jgi:hypothetical protein
MTNPTPTPQPADPVVSLLYKIAAKEAKDCQFETAVKIRACADSIAQRDASYPAAADQAEGPSLADVDELCAEFGFHLGNDTYDGVSLEILRDMITAAITRWRAPVAQPPAQPVSLAELRDPDFSHGMTPSQHLDVVHGGADPRVAASQVQGVLADRYEFSVVDSDDCEVAGGSAPMLTDVIREGRNYLSQYNQDGPHKLELRRVLVLDHSEATNA